MRISKHIQIVSVAFWAFCHIVFITSCTEADLNIRIREGTVTIHPHWQGNVFHPTTYNFFKDNDGELVYHEEWICTDEKLVQSVDEGLYRVLAYNHNADGVEFFNSKNYEQIIVQAKTQNSSRSTKTHIAQPSEVYAIMVEQLDVPDKGSILERPGLVPRTKKMKFHFSLSGITGIQKIEGTINGVFPSLILATGKPTQDAIKFSPTTVVQFSTNVTNGNGEANIRIFGIKNPKSTESSYSNKMILQLVDFNHDYQQVEVDMNQTISDILYKNEGEIPPGKIVNVNILIKPIGENGGLTATVHSWHTSIDQGQGAGTI